MEAEGTERDGSGLAGDAPDDLDNGKCGVDGAVPERSEELLASDGDDVKKEANSEAVNSRLHDEGTSNDSAVNEILDHVQHCPAVFKNQQIGDPELSLTDKRSVAEALLQTNPSKFLMRFGSFLGDRHFDYFSSSNDPEVVERVKQLRIANSDGGGRILRRNRRYEALKRLEAEGSYFSEAEMEKREPLLYHQLVGQFLSEKERLVKYRQSKSDVIPTFSNFLIEKMERDEVQALRKSQQEAEDDFEEEMSEDENSRETESNRVQAPRWGDDWIDAENAQKEKSKKRHKKQKKIHLSAKEKSLLLDEFKSLMHSKFLNGLESEFNYGDVDMNPDYDCLQVRSQDEEDKYFDEESCGAEVCTDTGIEDY